MMLHWAGTGFLVTGVLVAAQGISDVRREWTGRPGWVATVLTWLRLRPRPLHQVSVLHQFGWNNLFDPLTDWTKPAPSSTVEERLEWLEDQMLAVGKHLNDLHAGLRTERTDRVAGDSQEAEARTAGDDAIRKSLADRAGGGLRLQAWGVVFLLAGTVMTAMW